MKRYQFTNENDTCRLHDGLHGITITYLHGRFNDTQQVTWPADADIKDPQMIASIMRQATDYLVQNHSETL